MMDLLQFIVARGSRSMNDGRRQTPDEDLHHDTENEKNPIHDESCLLSYWSLIDIGYDRKTRSIHHHRRQAILSKSIALFCSSAPMIRVRRRTDLFQIGPRLSNERLHTQHIVARMRSCLFMRDQSSRRQTFGHVRHAR